MSFVERIKLSNEILHPHFSIFFGLGVRAILVLKIAVSFSFIFFHKKKTTNLNKKNCCCRKANFPLFCNNHLPLFKYIFQFCCRQIVA